MLKLDKQLPCLSVVARPREKKSNSHLRYADFTHWIQSLVSVDRAGLICNSVVVNQDSVYFLPGYRAKGSKCLFAISVG